MPTVLRIGRYRFFFYSNESQEPPHVHVQAAEDEAKFWLDPVSLAANHGFRSRDLTEIEQLVEDHRDQLIEAWNDYFG
jgi:hypothetical protein